ncbi:cyclic nucleotide-gated channel alpha-3-like isoform X1 [Tachypleus tridentatus]|uniref:cyclic nucleotide-gated channel alpha-3-like isoform X1 n=2 Tax=Tachypleus tridentatus TaxID=6853 RepID=UPI003FD07063
MSVRWLMENIRKLTARCRNRRVTILEEFEAGNIESNQEEKRGTNCWKWNHTFTIDPSGNFYYRWLFIISFAVLYNTLFIISRSVFWELQNYAPILWYVVDYLCDVIYIIDMMIQARTGYLEQGLLVRDSTKLFLNYVKSRYFKIDFASLLPTDILYMIFKTSCYIKIPCSIIVRLNRILKIYRIFELFDRSETRTSFPYAFRIGKLLFYILVIIHWNACLFFSVSYLIGFGNDSWVYQNVSIPVYATLNYQYIYCFYWSTLTLTTIGEVPVPVKDYEYLFVVIDFLIGVLIFATIVGNVGSMISSMNAKRAEFQSKMDSVKQYLEFRKVNKALENRVIQWFDYLWMNKESLDEDNIMSILPDKLKAEIALYVHLDTLKRVKLFQDCEAGLLGQLVLKLKLQVFSPGDYICRKGDVGKEMYIVKRGKLEVVADDEKTVFATLEDGSVFGELSILNISGMKTGNRRTANVRSVGYSDLFVLSKEDLWNVLEEYPEAKKMLVERGRQILMKDGLLSKEAIEAAKKENEKLPNKSSRLENTLNNMERRFTEFLKEYALSQREIKQLTTYLENLDYEIDD